MHEPARYGAWWFEQLPDVLAPIAFERHVIDPDISHAHAARFVDLDGDFVPELIEVADINLDGKPDIFVSSRKGLFPFMQE